MPTYEVTVHEAWMHEVTYRVEAESEEEAEQLVDEEPPAPKADVQLHPIEHCESGVVKVKPLG